LQRGRESSRSQVQPDLWQQRLVAATELEKLRWRGLRPASVKTFSQAASHAGGLVFLKKSLWTANFAVNCRLWENNQRLDFHVEHLIKTCLFGA
jgi:hypothetical protein